MKKTEIYVPIANKKEAEQAKSVLEALGEKTSKHNFYDGNEDALWFIDDSNPYWITCLNSINNCCKDLKQITLKQLIELLVKEQSEQKIAVRVDNEKEFNALMKYYDSLGWKSQNKLKLDYSHKFGFNSIITFNEGFYANPIPSENYQIAPFSDFAKEHNIKLPLILSEDGVWLYEGDEFWHVCVGDTSICLGVYNPIKLNELVGTPQANQGKFFSTKQSALDWIEAQKPKFPLINETKQEIVTEYEIEFNEKSSVLITKDNVKFNGSEFDLTQLEVLAIVSKFKSLQ